MASPILVGLAYSPITLEIISSYDDVDFVEVPFELLKRDFHQVSKELKDVNVFIHCSSLSLASSAPSLNEVCKELCLYLKHFNCGWVSDHVAFIEEESETDGQTYSAGFTVAPPLNKENVSNLESNIRSAQSNLPVPLIVENSPIYFEYPNNDLTYVGFWDLLLKSIQQNLLLDITHLLITIKNLKLDLNVVLESIPKDRITQIHLSGMIFVDGLWVDSHDRILTDEVLSILGFFAKSPNLKAITLEYNWISNLSIDEIKNQIYEVRKVLKYYE